MLSQPSDPLVLLQSLARSEHIIRMHTDWARLDGGPDARLTSGPKIRQRVQAVSLRLLGGSHRELLADLIRAVDAVAVRCDELSGRIGKLESVADDLARVLGEEVTQLRAAVQRLEVDRSESSRPARQ
jgi:hypothetical protein